jgi:hypothetical protein
MANAPHPPGPLRPVSSRLRGWTVVGADGEKIGTVHEQLADSDGASWLDVELDGTALAQDLEAGGRGQGSRITAGAYPADPNRPGARPLADAEPMVGESSRTAFLNTGSRQHAEEATGSVPRDDDRQGGSGRLEHPRVLIPLDATLLKEKDEQVVLETLRAVDLAALPAYAPA